MRREEGSASLVMLAVIGALLAMTVAVAAVGQYLVALGSAQTAADAAALAAAPVTFRPFGATGTAREEAVRFAGENSAELLACSCGHDAGWAPREVEVRVGREVRLVLFGTRRVEAVGRAEFAPALLLQAAPEG